MLQRVCTQCGKEFIISDGEIAFYNKKGLTLPKRCKECRSGNKNARHPGVNAGGTQSADIGNKTEYSFSDAPTDFSGVSKKITPKAVAISAAALLLIAIAVFSALGIFSPDNHQSTFLQLDSETSTTAPAQVQTDCVTSTYASETTTAATQAQTDCVTSAYTTQVVPAMEPVQTAAAQITYTFRSEALLTDHFEKHGVEMGFATAAAYQAAASNVINSPDCLEKTEKEDGDFVYYIEATNDFVILSTDGYIRTYFRPDDGKDYFDRQ